MSFDFVWNGKKTSISVINTTDRKRRFKNDMHKEHGKSC